MSNHTDAGMPCHDNNPLWREVQALTTERDELRRGVERLNQMLRDTGYGQGQIDAYGSVCDELDDLRSQLATARALLADYQGVANRLRNTRRYTCPYCQQPVTSLQYHEGPEDCYRELLGDDTDQRRRVT